MRVGRGAGGGEDKKEGGVEGAGMYSSVAGGVMALMMPWSSWERPAVIVVKDCEKEKTCSPSMCVKNSGKKRSSCWALMRALCRTSKVRGRNRGEVREWRSRDRLSVQSATCLAMLRSCMASWLLAEL